MRLSEAHLAPLRRIIPDPGPPAIAGHRPATDDDYARVVDQMLATRPGGQPFRVFAYGSLIWNPEFDFSAQATASARGWRRRFCLGWDHRFRGNPDAPGLMLALDRGGQCRGVVFDLPETGLEAELHRLIRREMSMVPTAFPPRWIAVEAPEGRQTALTFAMNRGSTRYVGGLDDEALAEILARACGFRGSMAEYIYQTVSKLESLGIHDRHLWRMQDLVARRIEAAFGLQAP